MTSPLTEQIPEVPPLHPFAEVKLSKKTPTHQFSEAHEVPQT
jgi:hypothetical protein